MKLSRTIIAAPIALFLFGGVLWFEYGPVPGYPYVSAHDLLRIREVVRRESSEPIVRIVPEGPGIVRVVTGRRGRGLDGGGVEYQLNETPKGWRIVGRNNWMSFAPKPRPEARAGRQILYTYSSNAEHVRAVIELRYHRALI